MSNNRLSLSHMSTGDRCHLCLLLREIGGREIEREGDIERGRREREMEGDRERGRKRQTERESEGVIEREKEETESENREKYQKRDRFIATMKPRSRINVS